MATIRPETKALFDEVESSSSKSFLFRNEAELLFELADQHSLRRTFDEITFYGKFVSHASTILKRVGATSDETTKLSHEFEEKVAKTASLVNTILGHAADEVQQQFKNRFFSHTHESMSAFITFLQELGWVKNYFLDREHSAK